MITIKKTALITWAKYTFINNTQLVDGLCSHFSINKYKHLLIYMKV